MLITAESSTAGNICDRACNATATGTRIEDTNNIKIEKTTLYNGTGCSAQAATSVRVTSPSLCNHDSSLARNPSRVNSESKLET